MQSKDIFRVNKKGMKVGIMVAILGLVSSAQWIVAQTTVNFTTAGQTQWTCPAGVTSVTVECWGGGGAGGGNNTSADGGGGGGGGGYSRSTSISVTPGNNYTVSVGSGGTKVSGATGGTGGDSWFINSSTILAKGGNGGNPPVGGAAGNGGQGGQATSGIGATIFSGGTGGNSNDNNNGRGGGGGSSAGTAANGTNGGNATNSANGSGGTAPTGGGNGGNGGNPTASDGSQPGGGGGGAGESATGAGNGAVGKVAITYTLPSCPTSTSVTPSTAQSVCQNASTNQLTATVTTSGGSGTPTLQYQWYYNTTNSNTISGATTVSGATSSTYTPQNTTTGTRYYFCVGYAADNGCGQTATTQSLASNTVQVTINALPGAVTVTGGGTFCGSATLTASGGTGGTIYFQGTTSNGTSTTTPGSSQVVTSSGTYYFRAMSAEGCWGTEGSATVIINPNPTITLGADPTVCKGVTSANLTYSATTASPNQYSINYDAAAEAQGFTDVTNASLPASPIVLIVPAGANPGTYNYTVTVIISGTGCFSSAYSKTITIDPPAPATPGPISGPTSVNPSTAGLVYSISAVTYATSYNWTVPTGWTITAGQGTTSITVTSGSAGQSGNISVTASNSCGTSAASTLPVFIISNNCPQSTAVAPSSPQTLCIGGSVNALTATVTTSGGDGTPTLLYQWYYNTANSNTIAGATLLTGETASTFTPQNSTAGTRYYFCVGYATDNSCGQTNATQSLASNAVQVAVETTPATPGAITGLANVAPNTPGLTYSITAVTYATSYTWTVPAGWTITAGQGTISITVTSGANGENGNITVTASNACGTSAASIKAVTVSANPPTITLGTGPTVCRGTTTASQTYSATTNNPDKYSIDYDATANSAGFVDVVDATLPASPIILAVPAAALVSTYYGTLRVKNSTTGLSSVAYTVTIILITTPATPGAISGITLVAQNTPGNQYSIGTVTSATTFTWTVPTGWTITAGQFTRNITVTSGAAGQNGNITVTAGNSCGTSAASSLAVQSVIPTDHATYGCNSCHIFHNGTGGALTFASNSTLCISCHQTGGQASGKPLSNAMRAVPGTSGTSHAWDVNAVNATRETVTPTNSQMSARLDNGKIICSTCHNQHNSNPDPNYLRISNTGDAMCKDCHNPRNVGKYSVSSPNNKGSHPVGVSYPGTGNYLTTPINGVLIPGNNVECSSCHQTHNAPDNNGYILRYSPADSNNLCISCHTLGTHNNMNCLTCHQTHNTNKSNIYMIRNTIATPNSGNKTVVFTSLTGTNSFADGNATYDGICEVCHTTTTHFRNNGGGSDQLHTSQGTDIPGKNCTSCHPHSSSFASVSCVDCHNTQTNYDIDAHDAHVTKYPFACNTCHFNYGSGGSLEPTHPSGGAANVAFNPSGLAKRNGLDANTPSWNSTAKTCSNIYCHSNGRSAYRGTDGTYTWSGTTGSQTATYTTTPSWATGSITSCTSCHPGIGNMTSPFTISRAGVYPSPPNTGAHQAGAHESNSQDFSKSPYLTPYWVNVQCFWCHDPDGTSINGPKLQGTYGSSKHVDGLTYFKPLNFANGGTMANGLNYSSNGSAGHCSNQKKCW